MCCACYRYAAYGHLGFTGGTVVQKLPANAGDTGDTVSIPGSGRSSGGGYGNPLLYSCLENPMDRGAWWATVHRVTESRTQLSTCARMLTLTYTCTHTHVIIYPTMICFAQAEALHPISTLFLPPCDCMPQLAHQNQLFSLQ